MLMINTEGTKSPPETNRLSFSHGQVEMIKTNELKSHSEVLTESQKMESVPQTMPD